MSDIKNVIAEKAVESVLPSIANKVTYGGGLIAFFGGLTATDIAAYGGLLMALIGLIFNTYYKIKEDRRAEQLHKAQMSDWDGRTERRVRGERDGN